MKSIRRLLSRLLSALKSMLWTTYSIGRRVRSRLGTWRRWLCRPDVVANFLAASFIVLSAIGAAVQFGPGIGLMVAGAISGVVAYWVGKD